MKHTVLQRVCREDFRDGFTHADGEAGTGIYFMVPNAKMKAYYLTEKTQENELVTIKLKPDHRIRDLTEPTILSHLIAYMKKEIDRTAEGMGSFYVKPRINRGNYQRFGRIIEDFVRDTFKDSGADGWIVNHEAKGTDLPKGKQVVITNESCFDVIDPVRDFSPPQAVMLLVS